MGDKLLVEVARRLKSCVRDSDTVARLGGDEFIVVVGDASRESVSQVCQRILTSLRHPFTEPEVDPVTGSIGISQFPEDGDDAETLLKHADIAMYESEAAQPEHHQLLHRRHDAQDDAAAGIGERSAPVDRQ